MVAVLWPNCDCTVLTLAPLAITSEAAVCLSSCTVTRGNIRTRGRAPASATAWERPRCAPVEWSLRQRPYLGRAHPLGHHDGVVPHVGGISHSARRGLSASVSQQHAPAHNRDRHVVHLRRQPPRSLPTVSG